jgi:hypothetical protein
VLPIVLLLVALAFLEPSEYPTPNAPMILNETMKPWMNFRKHDSGFSGDVYASIPSSQDEIGRYLSLFIMMLTTIMMDMKTETTRCAESSSL